MSEVSLSRRSRAEAAGDPWLVLSMALLLSIGILMVFSTTAVIAKEASGDSTTLIRSHLLHLGVGLGAYFVFSRLDAEFLRTYSRAALALILIILLLVLLPHVGLSAGGARRWISLGILSVQPGEIAKLVLVVYLAAYISRRGAKMSMFVPGTLVPLAISCAVCVLLLLEPDFGSCVVIGIIVFCQLAVAARIKHLLLTGAAAFGALLLALVTSPYRMRRVVGFLNPFEDPASSGYQLVQSLIAVGSGGMTGTGLGAGRQKLFYLPAAHTDFIYAVIAEELGLLGASAVLFLFLLLGYRGFRLARRLAQDLYLSSLALGCTLLILLPALLNMGVVLGLLPTKGMVLPLVGYGGTAMVVDLSALGILLRLSKMQI